MAEVFENDDELEEFNSENGISLIDGYDFFDEKEEEPESKPKKRKKTKKEEEEQSGKTRPWYKSDWFECVEAAAFAVVVAFVVTQVLVINAKIPSSSMENTIMKGDRLIGNRLAYIKNEPERGDIIIFDYPVNEKEKFIKRIIGLPGETVEIREAKIYINGSEEPLYEPYLKEEWDNREDGYFFVVPPDCYLVLGDNRNISMDARLWAEEAIKEGLADTPEEAEKYVYVTKDQILGKAMFAYYPKLEKINSQRGEE